MTLLGGLLSLADAAEIPLVSDTTVSDGVGGIAEGETSAVISITVTGDPDAPIDPTVTTDPSETLDPSVTTDPSVTVDPSITTDPSVTVDPALTTTEVTTTEPRPSTEPVTKTGAAQSRPASPLSTDPGEGEVTAQTVPGQTAASTPEVSGNAPIRPSESSAAVTTAPSGGSNLPNGTQAHDSFGIAIVGVVFAIAAIVSTVAVILTKYMKRS